MVGVVSAALTAAWAAVIGWLAAGVTGLLIVGGVGMLGGALYGWAVAKAKAYDLTSPGGIAGFVIDHSWSMPNTALGGLFLGINLLKGNSVSTTFSQTRNHVGLNDKFFPNYDSTTIGPVQAGIGAGINKHEGIHVLQARLFGPMYVPLVLLNFAVATVLPYWLIPHTCRASKVSGVGSYFTSGVYPHVLNEVWAYHVEGSPP